MKQNHPKTLVLVLCTIVWVAMACGDDPTEPPPPPPPVYELPATPDSLIRAYRDAYEFRHMGTIDSLLAPDFSFTFAEMEIDSFHVEPTWGKTDELESSRRLFEGSEGVWPNGTSHPPIDEIFPFGTQLLPKVGSEWTLDPKAGTFSRDYEISMIIQYIDGCIDIVSGTQRFEVIDMSTIGGPNGEEATGYAILDWQDMGLGSFLPVESAFMHVGAWGFVKAAFRANADGSP